MFGTQPPKQVETKKEESSKKVSFFDSKEAQKSEEKKSDKPMFAQAQLIGGTFGGKNIEN